MSLTRDQLLSALQQQLKGIYSEFTSDELTEAVDDLLRETGWSFPFTTQFKEFWGVKRAKRNCLSLLLNESAHKFKYKQINLQHRWEHYFAMLKAEDEAWEKAKLENPEQFPVETTSDSYKYFGSKIDAGFAYDSYGNDITHDTDEEVDFYPNEDS